MSYQWMPIMGEFDTSADRIVFKGHPGSIPESGQPQPQPQPLASVGILLSDHKMVTGSLRATVEFAEITPLSVCELIISYDLKTKSQITAGLGGSSAMFSIRQWGPPSSPQSSGAWTNYELSGDRANLRHGVKYELNVRVQGSLISLEVNGVQVGVTTLPFAPNQPGQTGIFCVSQSDITVSDFMAKSERPKAFIVMQFSSPYNEVYSHVIKDLCDEFKLDAVRGDELYGPGIIIKDVIDRISRSQVIIADISPTNPNVYFEVGYALALGKPIILLAQRRGPESPLPFDLSAFRVLFYDDSIGGKPKLEAGLRNHLQEILSSNG
jgi:hypothetical protein